MLVDRPLKRLAFLAAFVTLVVLAASLLAQDRRTRDDCCPCSAEVAYLSDMLNVQALSRGSTRLPNVNVAVDRASARLRSCLR